MVKWKEGEQVHHAQKGRGEVVGVRQFRSAFSSGIGWNILRFDNNRIYRVNSNDRAGWHLVGSATAKCEECNKMSKQVMRMEDPNVVPIMDVTAKPEGNGVKLHFVALAGFEGPQLNIDWKTIEQLDAAIEEVLGSPERAAWLRSVGRGDEL